MGQSKKEVAERVNSQVALYSMHKSALRPIVCGSIITLFAALDFRNRRLGEQDAQGALY